MKDCEQSTISFSFQGLRRCRPIQQRCLC